MSMFDTAGKSAEQTGRSENTLRKLERMNRALRHQEPDRVPVSDFFWGSFIERWRRELGLAADANPYYHYDLDWIVTVPNMDPWIRPFETLKETAEEVVVKTGFGAVMHKHFEFPMPEMRSWETDTFEKLERAEFDDPRDRRRFFAAGDNQIAGVGDGFQRNTPPWIDTVKSLRPDFPVYGSMIEVSECLTRLIGQANTMLWMGEYPERMGAVINRLGAFYLEMAKAEMRPEPGLLDGFVIWGDVAYKKSTFMSPSYWREHFKPWVAQMVRARPCPRAAGDLSRLRQREGDLPRLHRNGHRRLQPARSESRHGRVGIAPPLRPGDRLLRQQQHSGLGNRRSRRPSAARSCASSTPPKAAATSSSPTTRSAAPSPATPTTTSSNWSANTANTPSNWANSTSRCQARLKSPATDQPHLPCPRSLPTPCSAW